MTPWKNFKKSLMALDSRSQLTIAQPSELSLSKPFERVQQLKLNFEVKQSKNNRFVSRNFGVRHNFCPCPEGMHLLPKEEHSR
jgi:hypothetical protein